MISIGSVTQIKGLASVEPATLLVLLARISPPETEAPNCEFQFTGEVPVPVPVIVPLAYELKSSDQMVVCATLWVLKSIAISSNGPIVRYNEQYGIKIRILR